jgi:hypothetical protein
MPVSLAHVLAETNLRSAWSRTNKRAQIAYQGERGDVPCDAQVLADVVAAPVAAVRELLADVADLAHIGAGFGSTYQLDQTAEPVWKVAIDGRVVYAHHITSRVLQHACAQVIGPAIEKVLPPTVFSYRPARDRWTALLHARRLIRHGNVFVAKVDVRRFFPSVRVDQVVEASVALVPDLDEPLVRLTVWFNTAPILGLGSPQEDPLYALYQGAVIAPLLSNLVAAYVLDLPLARHAPKGVHALRYGDDVLIVGVDRGAVTNTRDFVVELIENAGWEAHPEKTFACAHDLRDATITWLGKTVGVDAVSTPESKVDERVEALVAVPPGDDLAATMAAALVNELFLDRRARVDAVLARVAARNPRHARVARNMVAHLAHRRRKRMRAYDALLSRAPFTALAP